MLTEPGCATMDEQGGHISFDIARLYKTEMAMEGSTAEERDDGYGEVSCGT